MIIQLSTEELKKEGRWLSPPPANAQTCQRNDAASDRGGRVECGGARVLAYGRFLVSERSLGPSGVGKLQLTAVQMLGAGKADLAQSWKSRLSMGLTGIRLSRASLPFSVWLAGPGARLHEA